MVDAGARREAIPLLVMLAFGLAMFATKLWVIGHYGNATPFWDQWDGEVETAYLPFLRGTLDWDHLLAPHNEHRILMTRLLSILVLEVNGLWNPLLQMALNALLHVLAVSIAVWVVCHRERSGVLAPVLLSCLVLFGLPYAWENTLAGFQSQFYFLLIFSSLSLWLGASGPALGTRWWGAGLLALASYFSMASGAITFLALASLAMYACVMRRSVGVRDAIAAACMLAAFAACYSAIPVLDHHNEFRAGELRAFYDAAISALSWPLPPKVGNVLVRNAPGLLILGMAIRTRRHDALTLFLVGLLAWTIGQSLSIAYGRALYPRSSRFLDLYAWATLANLLCVSVLLAEYDRRRAASAVACGLWTAWTLGAVVLQAVPIPGQLSAKKAESALQEANTKAYVLTGNPEYLQGNAIPYPDPKKLALALDNPAIRAILPSNLRPPLEPVVRIAPPDSFVAGGTFPATVGGEGPSWGSYTTRGDAEGGVARFSYQLPAGTGAIALPISGYPGRDGVSIEARQGAKSRSARPAVNPGERWDWLTIPASAGPFELVVTDHSPTTWIAVGRAQMMGRLDNFIRTLLDHPEWPAFASFLICLGILMRRAVVPLSPEEASNVTVKASGTARNNAVLTQDCPRRSPDPRK